MRLVLKKVTFFGKLFQDDTLGVEHKSLYYNQLTIFRVTGIATLKMVKSVIFTRLRSTQSKHSSNTAQTQRYIPKTKARNCLTFFPGDDHESDGDESYDYAYYDIECQGLTEENGSYGDCGDRFEDSQDGRSGGADDSGGHG